MNSKIENTKQELIEVALKNGYSYEQYRNLVAHLAEKGESTGSQQSEVLANYTQLNNRRMKRWDKTLKFSDEAIEKINAVTTKTTWIVLSESWCGDASPALPIMHKITELNPNISLKIVLRDEHINLMHQFLTNGAMSIPKLIAVDSNTYEVTSDWGPRSKNATQLVEDYKAEHGKLTPEFKKDLQVWYNKDKGHSILEDLLAILD